MIIRDGRNSDKERLKEIWKERFGDEDSFIDWFFNERFDSFHCSVLELNGKIASSLYSVPIKIKVRDNYEKGILVSGVSTLSEYEGRGCMRQTLSYHLKKMRDAGFNISILKAVKPEIYYSLEHRLINNVQIIYPDDAFSSYDNVKNLNFIENISELYECFIKFSEMYSGSIIRSYDEFCSKCNEYLQTGGQCFAVFSDNVILGYCFYYINDGEFYGEECVGLSNEVYESLFEYIRSLNYEKKKLRVADNVRNALNCSNEIVFGNSAYCMNVRALLMKTGLSGYAIEIFDNVIDENNGIFSLNGDIINDEPLLKISSGHLTQWIFGFQSISELIEEGAAEVLNSNEIVDYMDSIGKYMTYVIDEY